MSGQLAVVPRWDDPASLAACGSGPVHRSIVAVDVEGSTKRTNPVKGEMRRVLYDLLERALKAAGIGTPHLEELADRGDGVLILIRPHDDVPKTVLFGRLIPALTALLARHNAVVGEPDLQMRLRVVVHAGEVHDDGRGFYGDDIDVAFRLLNSPTVKRALRQASMSPLALVISEEMWYGIVRHGYVKGGPYEQRVQVRVGERRRRGRVHIPVPARSDLPARMARAGTARPGPSLVIASGSEGAERATAGYAALNGREGHRPGPGSPGAGRR
jgi:class 3 adenylate cyclase